MACGHRPPQEGPRELREDVLPSAVWEFHPLPGFPSEGKENPASALEQREAPATPPQPLHQFLTEAVEEQLIRGLGIVLRGLLSICAHLFLFGNSRVAALKTIIKETLIAWDAQRGNYIVRGGAKAPLRWLAWEGRGTL